MSTEKTNIVYGPIANMQEIIAASATFQTLVGAADAAAAVASVYSPLVWDTEIKTARPFALVDFGDSWDSVRDSTDTARETGAGLVQFDAYVPTPAADSPSFEITGNGDPAVNAHYFLDGTHNGQPKYSSFDGRYEIWWDSGVSKWKISTEAGDVSAGHWISPAAAIEATYAAVTYAGTPTVAAYVGPWTETEKAAEIHRWFSVLVGDILSEMIALSNSGGGFLNIQSIRQRFAVMRSHVEDRTDWGDFCIAVYEVFWS